MSERSSSEILVLLTGAFHGFGGIETFNRSLVHALDHLAAARGLRVRVLSILDDPHPPLAAAYAPSGALRFLGFRGRRARFSFAACRAARSAEMLIVGHANLLPLLPLMNMTRPLMNMARPLTNMTRRLMPAPFTCLIA